MITTPKATSDRYRAQGHWADRQLHDLLYANAARQPQQIALADPSNKPDLSGTEPLRLSYAEVTEAIARLSARLLESDIQRDDILLVQMPNIVELALLYLAASRIGAIISPVPMQYQANELANIIAILEPAAVIGVARFKGEDSMATLLGSVTHSPVDTQPKALCWGTHPLCDDLNYTHVSAASIEACNCYCDQQPRSGDDVLTICWTSGTEGTPKGIPRSHNQWLTVGLATYEGNRIETGETLLNPFPFINMASIGGLFLSWLYSGGKLVLHHPLELPVFLRQIVEEQVSYTLAPPALLNMLLKNDALLSQCDLSSLRAIGSGSAPLDEWMVAGFKSRFDIEIVNHFGSNEGVCLLCGPDHTDSAANRARLFPRAHDTLETCLIDPDGDAEITRPDSEGELQIKGPSVFDGYFKDPERTRSAFTADGYFRTGDLFRISSADNAFYEFVGRRKDLIIRGGVNIAPAELDNLLCAHPDVAEAAVAGFPCEVMGERVAAYVVPKLNARISLEDVVYFLRQRRVANFKLPERLEILSALPRNPLGKVVRSQLTPRETAAAVQ